MNLNYLKNELPFLTIITLLILLINLSNCPLFHFPGRDSGVFLYSGHQILSGNIPYKDFWDHKPPLIFYINAIGLILGAGTIWGVWILEIIFLILTGIFSFKLLNYLFNKNFAFIGTILWLLYLNTIIEGGNLTTEYALPLQFGIFLLFYRGYSNQFNDVKRSPKKEFFLFFLIGILSSLLFLLKPNLIAIFFGIFLLLLISNNIQKQIKLHKNVYMVLGLLTGSILPILIFSFYFFINNAFFDFVNAVIVYNLLYSSETSIPLKFYSIYAGFYYLLPLSIIAFFGWIFLFYNIFYRVKTNTKSFPILFVILISFPIEVFLTGYSGRGYPHYFMSWLPYFSILITYFLYSISEISNSTKSRYKLLIILLIIILVFFPLFMIFKANFYLIKSNTNYIKILSQNSLKNIYQNDTCLDIIENQTSKEDFVLLWGAETVYNYLSNRKSPTKYVYQYPLFNKKYNQNELKIFLLEIKKHQPMLIIDTSSTNELIPPLNKNKRNKWYNLTQTTNNENLDMFFNYVDENYLLIAELNNSHWEIYKKR